MRPITGKELCRLLNDAGWTLKRIKGSHHIFGKPGERKIIAVPVHGNQSIKPGLALRISRRRHFMVIHLAESEPACSPCFDVAAIGRV